MKKITKLWIVLLICVMTLAAVLFWAWTLARKEAESTHPTEDASKPVTWDEYQDLSREEQDAFQQEQFGSKEEYEAWVESVKPTEQDDADLLWDKPDKKPDAYTWEEYQKLSEREKEAFFQWFPSTEAFETWMNGVKPVESDPTIPEWKSEGKKPDEYTWEEYQKLSLEEQDSFFRWFSSKDAFEAWMQSVEPVEEEGNIQAWNKPGKKPDEYTWEEYNALTYEEQDAFFLWFESKDDFEAWMETVKPQEETSGDSWNKPGKKPDEYTWEEYQALTPQEQDQFFLWFGSVEDFEAWMDAAKGEEAP